MKKVFLVISVFSVFVTFSCASFAQASAKAPAAEALSVEDLMFMEIPAMTATLTKVEANAIPASMTVITAKDIAITPARNIYDLLAIYVPGAQIFAHVDSKIGVRGIISDRNTKVLLLLNGKNINDKATQGAVAELAAWDLNDIDRIEVISGPGSVTYGPGAISCVINIVTKDAKTVSGGAVGYKYITNYNSRGGYVSYGKTFSEDLDVYGYFSNTDTKGYTRGKSYEINGTTGAHGYLTNPPPYQGDGKEDGQQKIDLAVNFLKEWKAAFHYSNLGIVSNLNSSTMYALSNGDVVPSRFDRIGLMSFNLTNTHDFTEKLNLTTTFAYDQESYYDYTMTTASRGWDAGKAAFTPDAGNRYFDYGQEEYFIKSTAGYTVNDKLSVSAGLSYTHDRWFSTNGQKDIYMNWTTTTIPNGAYYANAYASGLNTYAFAAFGEINWKPHRLFNIIFSGRMDMPNLVKTAYSPRVAIVSELNDTNILKYIWQRSARMANTEDMIKASAYNGQANAETLTGYEVIYVNTDIKNTELSTSISYDDIIAKGFTNATGGNTGNVLPLAREQIISIEPAAKYKIQDWTVGMSHSFSKLVDFKQGKGVTRQGLSYSQFGPINSLTGVGGHELNNWSQNATKLFVTAKPMDKLTLHTDMQIYWGYEGTKDAIKVYDKRYGTSNATWNAIKSDLNGKDAGDAQLALNISLAYDLPEFKGVSSTITLWGMNLFSTRRYLYSTGENANYPAKIGWVKEPASFGFKYDVKF